MVLMVCESGVVGEGGKGCGRGLERGLQLQQSARGGFWRFPITPELGLYHPSARTSRTSRTAVVAGRVRDSFGDSENKIENW
jgi:hypothetical protein